ncbi:MAG: SIR2 family protein [Chloroflexales bacterium]|nr:SIR2 family protein [Chloroflexales bacterium]
MAHAHALHRGDLPRAETGLPSRADLARSLALRHGLAANLSLAETAQRVAQARSRWSFTAFLRDSLDATALVPQPFQQWVVELVRQFQIETIITTACDNLLDRAFQQAGLGLNRLVRGSDVSFSVSERPTLIKLYGNLQQPDSLIVIEQDHSALLRDRTREPILDEVRRAMRRTTVLFLGYNLADPDFRFLFDQSPGAVLRAWPTQFGPACPPPPRRCGATAGS